MSIKLTCSTAAKSSKHLSYVTAQHKPHNTPVTQQLHNTDKSNTVNSTPRFTHPIRRQYVNPLYGASSTDALRHSTTQPQNSHPVHRTARHYAASYTTTTKAAAAATAEPTTQRHQQQPVRSGKQSKMKAAAEAQRQFALHLYRAILSAHKITLDPILRDMGDTYVRDEFKRHKTAKPQYVPYQ